MRIHHLVVLLVVLTVLAVTAANRPKYIFLFIGDGMSTPQRMVAEEFSIATGHGPLAINAMPIHATTRTRSANALVTDSAAAATAIACGEKTNNQCIGMSADGQRRLESTAEVAHANGLKVGIVTSVTINHATPAGFYAHQRNRSMGYEIGVDLVNSNFDYFGGGGFGKANDANKRKEGQADLFELAEQNGYLLAKTPEAIRALKAPSQKVIAICTKEALPYSIDSNGSNVPTLAEFTQKGIELLQDGPKGFFMMVEGGAIDWHGHSNDAATNLRDVLAFDDAVKVAIAFYEKHPQETLIVVTGDHETGGLSMGFAGTGYNLYVERLSKQTCSTAKFDDTVNKAMKKNPEFSFENAKAMLEKSYGFCFTEQDEKKNPMAITPKQLERLETAFKAKKLGQTAKLILAEKSGISWTTGSHTAMPVLTTSMGVSSERFQGFLDNTDIAKTLKAIITDKH